MRKSRRCLSDLSIKTAMNESPGIYNECLKKAPFDTWMDAAAIALKEEERVKLRVYECSVCGYWHLTSKE